MPLKWISEVPRSYDKLVVARARLISRLRNRHWHPYSTNDKRKCVKTSGLDHLDADEFRKGPVQELASTTMQVLPNDVDIPRSKALVKVPKLTYGLPKIRSEELELMDYAELPSSQPMTRRSGEITSTETASLPESAGQAVPLEEYAGKSFDS